MILSESRNWVMPLRVGASWNLPDGVACRATLWLTYLPLSKMYSSSRSRRTGPDCLSVCGLAREIAAVTEMPFEEDVYYPFPWGEHTVGRGRYRWKSGPGPVHRDTQRGYQGDKGRRISHLAQGTHRARWHEAREHAVDVTKLCPSGPWDNLFHACSTCSR